MESNWGRPRKKLEDVLISEKHYGDGRTHRGIGYWDALRHGRRFEKVLTEQKPGTEPVQPYIPGIKSVRIANES